MKGDPCEIPECDRTFYARGWCTLHYQRWRRTGDPLQVRKPADHREYVRTPDADRFWAKVDKTETCWLWKAGLSVSGYGHFSPHDRRRVMAHRWAYEHLVGPIPQGLQLDHLCRVTACVRPDHLEPVTGTENIRRSFAARFGNACSKGHEWTPENTYIRKTTGTKMCRACRRVQK